MESLTRYPGGKVYQAKHIVPYINVNPGGVFCEAFVGGGSILLAVAEIYVRLRYNVRFVANDLDPGVAAFWRVISGDNEAAYRELYRRLLSITPTTKLFWEIRNRELDPSDMLELAWQFFFCNRTCIIPSNGQRPMTKIGDRWTKGLPRLMQEARDLLKGRTTVYNEDFSKVIALAQPDWVLYLDPPYYKAGSKLYTKFQMSEEKHIELRDQLRATPADWVLSYDWHSRIFELYEDDWTAQHLLDVSYSMTKRKDIETIIVPRRTIS